MKPYNKYPASHRKCKMQRNTNNQNVALLDEIYLFYIKDIKIDINDKCVLDDQTQI